MEQKKKKKKGLKIVLVVVLVLLALVAADTMAARVFKRSPLISFKEDLDGTSYVDRGIIIDTFYCKKDKDVEIEWLYKFSKFTCPKKVQDETIYGYITEVKDNSFIIEITQDNSYSKVGDVVNIIPTSGKFDYTKNTYVKLNGLTNKENEKLTMEAKEVAVLDKTDLDSLKNSLGALISTKKTELKETKLSKIIDVSLKKVDYSYSEKTSAGMYVILKTSDSKVTKALNSYFKKKDKNYQKMQINEYIVYVYNGQTDYKLVNELSNCVK